MKREKYRLLLLLILLFVVPSLTGCWDYKVLKDMSYVSSVGIDYVDNQFVVYTQMVDFASVGKVEGSSSEEASSNIWVGKATGSTFLLAWNNLYNSIQQKVHIGQVSSVVFTQKAMQMHLNQTIDMFERSEARLTPWIFTTEEPMDDLFSITPMFPSSPLFTKLNSPESNYKQHSMIRPLKFLEFVALYSEPSTSIIVPTLSIDKNNWKQKKKKMPEMTINGAIIYHTKKKPRWMSKDDLLGLRWLEEKTNRTPLALNDDNGDIKAILNFEHPNVRVKPELSAKGDPVYNLHIKVQGELTQLNIPMTSKKLKAEAEARIKAEIRSTYTAGLKNNVDVYHLEETMFRHRYADWKRLTSIQSFPFTKNSLRDIQVDVEITNTGMSKFKS
ncbi:Ger(x)C family spore germination protein [Neobacillus pocheonensis]|uniref:Ger(x)C family spore germination protein n=1 Tax=Neobacillus pocheonensis TaxID=363869 RepID=UPI003D268F3B